MSAIPRLKKDQSWPIVCGVCRRRASGIGFAPGGYKPPPVLWLCDDPRCHRLGKTAYQMPECKMDEFESRARFAAGQDAGAYLDEIGKTDLETLSEREWLLFIDKVILGFEQSLREQLTKSAAPF